MKNIRLFFIAVLCLSSLHAQETARPKVGLVLSGGGAKGFAHIGVLKEIEKAGLKLDYIGGTSMGAVVGGLYATGYSANEIDSIICSLDFKKLLQDIIPRNQSSFFEKQYGEKHLVTFPVSGAKISLPKAIAKGQSVYNELNRLFESVHNTSDFDELPIPFFCVATDLETGTIKVFDEGQLATAIRASASLPSLLDPMEVDGVAYIDGGVADNFPVEEMQRRGIDIIIGVDVQGTLDTSEEIQTVLDVLNQIVNYQMYGRDEEKINQLDVHIRPDLGTYGVTSFDDAKAIIKLGEETAAVFQEAFHELALMNKEPVEKRKPVPPAQKLRIDWIDISPLKHYSRAYIKGEMNIDVGDSISYEELNVKINRLASSNDFDLIKYRFEKLPSSENVLHIKVQENKTHSFVKAGFHFDPLYKSSFLLNFTTKHMLQKNDILSADMIFGDNVRANLNYFVNNGFYTSYGLNSRFNSLSADVRFDGEEVNSINKHFIDFTSMLYVQTTFNRKFAVGAGLEYKLIETFTDALVRASGDDTFFFDRSNYLNTVAYLKLDSYDEKFFPKNGFLVDGEFKYYMSSTDYNDNFNPFCQVKLQLSGVKTLFHKLSFHLTAEGGLTFEENTSNQFLYALGGFGENMINNHIPFFGYDYEYYQNHSYLKGMLEVRYEIVKDHSIGLIANYARTDLDVFNDGAVFQDIFSGYAIQYGYNSILGPIRLIRDWSPDINNQNWYLSVGFWF